MPPTLIIHGDANQRLPFQQSETFVQRATAAGPRWPDQASDMAVLADWFDQYLRGVKK